MTAPAPVRALGGVDLLIPDDWGLEPLAAARHDILEIRDDRYGRERHGILVFQCRTRESQNQNSDSRA